MLSQSVSWTGGMATLVALCMALYVPALLRHRCVFLPPFAVVALAFVHGDWRYALWPTTLVLLALYTAFYRPGDFWSYRSGGSKLESDSELSSRVPTRLRAIRVGVDGVGASAPAVTSRSLGFAGSAGRSNSPDDSTPSPEAGHGAYHDASTPNGGVDPDSPVSPSADPSTPSHLLALESDRGEGRYRSRDGGTITVVDGEVREGTGAGVGGGHAASSSRGRQFMWLCIATAVATVASWTIATWMAYVRTDIAPGQWPTFTM